MKSSKSPKMSLEEEAQVLSDLKAMESDEQYVTRTRYSPNTTLYPDNVVSFSSWHMSYIRRYPSLNPQHYVENLRLITRVR